MGFLCCKIAAFIPDCMECRPNIDLKLFNTLKSFRLGNSASTFRFIASEMVYLLSASSVAPSCNEVGFPSVWSCMLFLAPDLTHLIEDEITFSSVD